MFTTELNKLGTCLTIGLEWYLKMEIGWEALKDFFEHMYLVAFLNIFPCAWITFCPLLTDGNRDYLPQ